MTPSSSDIGSRRLDLAGTRDFHVAGAGRARRAALSTFNREWLAEVWRSATGGTRIEGVALAAVGSLGRADAGPLSDYDLVLLHSERSLPAKELTALADRIWYPIWDAGVRLDHSVRTVTQCRQVAAADLTAAVGLLDLAPLAGDAELVAAARSTVAHDWRGNARKRLPQLVEAQATRHARQGDLAQSIEPELKEAHGGLRDMTVLAALAEAWLTDRPHGGVDAAHELLLDVRDAVHVVTGRGRDRLGREDHDAVAALLGYPDADDLLTAVSGAGRLIAYALDGTVRRAGQSQRARTLRVGPRRPQMTPLGHGLFASDGEVVLGSARLAETDSAMALRAGVVAARAGLPVAPATLENLAATVSDLPTPWPVAARDLLGDLLASGQGLVTVWEGLDQVGIVERWLPEWAAVRSRPQRNAVHRHTVDRHLVETVVRAAGLVRRTSRPDLLLVAALLHDIGKVRGAHDHSVVGAETVRTIATRWGFSPRDVEVLVTLVREHLTVIELATRRDHQDPATVDAAVAAVGGDREVFEILLALTEADASAAGPLAWTDWRAALLEQLAAAVRARLDAPRPEPGSPAPTATPEGSGRSTRRSPRPCGPGNPGSGSSPGAARTASTSSTSTGSGSSPTPPGCSPPRGTRSGRPSCAPSTASRSTSGTSSPRAARCPTPSASSAGWPAWGAATAARCRPSTGGGRTCRGPRGSRASARPARPGPSSSPARARRPPSSRSAPRTGRGCSTSSGPPSPGRGCRCARPTSPPTRARPSTPSTSPGPTAGRSRRPGWPRP